MEKTVYILKELTNSLDAGPAYYASAYEKEVDAKREMWKMVEKAQHLGYGIEQDNEWLFTLMDQTGNCLEYEVVPAKIQ